MPQFGTTPLSTTTLGSNQFPVSAAFVPGSGVAGNLTSIEGIAINTDANGFQTTAMRIGLKDGDDVTLGSKTDARSTATDATAVTVMQVLKEISFMAQTPASTPVTGTFWQATQPVSGTVTANAGSGTFTVGQATGTNLHTVVDSGTVTANIGTTNGLALDATVAKLNVAQGAALGTNTGPMLQGSVTTAAPTYTTGNINPLSLTTAGALRIDGSGATQPVSGTVTANAGSGTFTVSGTITANQGGTWAVTANAGTNLNTSALALDTSVNGLLLTQGSTTSGEKGPLVQGSVTTNAPSYTTAQTSPISLDTSGLLRVSLKDTPANTNNFNVNLAASAATVTVTGTVTANQGGSNWSTNVAQIGGQAPTLDNTGIQAVSMRGKGAGTAGDTAVKLNSSGDLYILGDFTEQASLSAGALNADLVPSTDVSAYSAFILQLTGTWTGTLTVQWSNDNSTFNPGEVSLINTAGGITSGSMTSNGSYYLPRYGRFLRIRMTSYTSGTANGTLEEYTLPIYPLVSLAAASQSGTWTVQPGNTANTTPWLVQPVTGTAGGSTSYHNVVSSGTNGTNVKASAGQVYDGSLSNTSGSAVYFRFYDTSGAPTVGTTTTKRTIQVPGNGTVLFSWPNGLKFTSGIAYGITTAIADNDTTAIAAAVSIDFGYD